MAEKQGFWDVGPHTSLPVEVIWDEFILIAGGKRIANDLPKSPDFDNADYLFEDLEVVLELKEIETEFLRSKSSHCKFEQLLKRLADEDPSWRPVVTGW